MKHVFLSLHGYKRLQNMGDLQHLLFSVIFHLMVHMSLTFDLWNRVQVISFTYGDWNAHTANQQLQAVSLVCAPPLHLGRFHRYTSNRNSCSSFIKTCFLIHKNLFLLSHDLLKSEYRKVELFLLALTKV